MGSCLNASLRRAEVAGMRSGWKKEGFCWYSDFILKGEGRCFGGGERKCFAHLNRQ